MRIRDPNGLLNPILRLSFSLVLIGALFYFAGTADTLAQFKTVGWGNVALVTAVLASHVFVVAPRWALILASLGHPVRSSELVGSVFLGFLFNQLLPTAVGGDVLRAWRARQLGVPLNLAVHSVILDRASGILVVLMGALILLPMNHLAVAPDLLWRSMAIGIGTLGTGWIGLWALGKSPKLDYPIIGLLQRILIQFTLSVRALLRFPGLLFGIVALAAAGQLIVVGAIWLLAAEVQVSLPFVDIAIITFGAMLASAIPVSVAGWGVREGALIFLFGAYGVPADRSLVISVLFGACMVMASLPGALVLLNRRLTPRSNPSDP